MRASQTVKPQLAAADFGVAEDWTRFVQAGQVVGDVRRFGRRRRLELAANARTLRLIAPLSGAAVVVVDGGVRHIAAGAALILNRPQAVECLWSAGASGVLLRVPVGLVQRAVPAVFAEARRLAPVDHVVRLDGEGARLGAALAELRDLAAAEGAPEPAGLDLRLGEAVVRALKGEAPDDCFPVSRSLMRAVDHLRAHPESRCSAEALAGIAGVTLPTLQRNVRTCLDMSLARFVERERLGWVRDRLRSAEECRSIARLAEAVGYRTATTLARNYQRLFGETPTQTRARAFAPRGR